MKPDIAGAAHGHVVAQRQMNRAEHFFIFQNSAVYLCGIVSANAQLCQIAGFRSYRFDRFGKFAGLLAAFLAGAALAAGGLRRVILLHYNIARSML